MSELVPYEDRDGALELAKLSPEARAFAAASLAPETLRVYGYHWRAFERWCEARALESLPAAPPTVAEYFSFRSLRGVPPEESKVDQDRDARLRAAGVRVYVPRRTYTERWSFSSMGPAKAAIRLRHRLLAFANPCDSQVVDSVLAGIRRVAGAARDRREALPADALAGIAEKLGTDLRGLRDRALILVGFAGALRRSELAAIEVEDLREEPEGYRLDLKRHFSGKTVLPGTKTNVGGAERELVALRRGRVAKTCPVAALSTWLAAARISTGRVFRAVRRGTVGEPLTPQTVALIVKGAVQLVGLDPADFAGHSLRSGLATSAYRAKHSMEAIRKKGRWASYEMLKVYIREAGLFEDDAAEGLL